MGKQAIWLHFQVEYKPGKLNAAADALSRRDEHGSHAATCAISSPEFELFEAFKQESLSLPEVVSKRQEIQAGNAGTEWSVVDDFVLHQGKIFVLDSSTF